MRVPKAGAGLVSGLVYGLVLLVAAVPAEATATVRVSVSATGTEADDGSNSPAVSTDGRYVAFSSFATNLVPSDTNGRADIFLVDRAEGTIERASVSSGEDQGDGHSLAPTISADGRFVAYFSTSSNLVPGDTNGVSDVFVRDRLAGHTSRVSVSSDGGQGNAQSRGGEISADGRFVAFHSEASNLVPEDTNGDPWPFIGTDVFVHDRMTGVTERVSVSSSGEQGNNESYATSISANGHLVAFYSFASNLVPDDSNGAADAFLHDRQTGQTERVSVGSNEEEANDRSFRPVVSADGHFVAFESIADNLSPGDVNGVLDVFLRDRVSGETKRISLSYPERGSEEALPDASHWLLTGGIGSSDAAISADGRFVAFQSTHALLVPGDLNGQWDIFVFDAVTGGITRVSVSAWGDEANDRSLAPAISADGSVVAFESYASNLVAGDQKGQRDVFARLRGSGTCESGAYEDGRLSSAVHELLEPDGVPSSPTVHDTNCGRIAPLGL